MGKYEEVDITNLRIMCEGYDDGEGLQIYNKCSRAEAEKRMNIRITFLQKDFLGYKLENLEFLTDSEIKTLQKVLGYSDAWINQIRENGYIDFTEGR